MARARQDKDEPEDDDDEDEVSEETLARDFILARLAICRGELAAAASELDEALALFNSPDLDSSGKKRKDALDTVDASIAEAARAVQLAMPALSDYDPKETEPGDEDE